MSSNQNSTASGNYEYTIPETGDLMLQIFSNTSMSSIHFTAQETLDLFHFLQSHQAEIEVKAQQQAQEAQQPKPKKTIEQRIDDLFR